MKWKKTDADPDSYVNMESAYYVYIQQVSSDWIITVASPSGNQNIGSYTSKTLAETALAAMLVGYTL